MIDNHGLEQGVPGAQQMMGALTPYVARLIHARYGAYFTDRDLLPPDDAGPPFPNNFKFEAQRSRFNRLWESRASVRWTPEPFYWGPGQSNVYALIYSGMNLAQLKAAVTVWFYGLQNATSSKSLYDDFQAFIKPQLIAQGFDVTMGGHLFSNYTLLPTEFRTHVDNQEGREISLYGFSVHINHPLQVTDVATILEEVNPDNLDQMEYLIDIASKGIGNISFDQLEQFHTLVYNYALRLISAYMESYPPEVKIREADYGTNSKIRPNIPYQEVQFDLWLPIEALKLLPEDLKIELLEETGILEDVEEYLHSIKGVDRAVPEVGGTNAWVRVLPSRMEEPIRMYWGRQWSNWYNELQQYSSSRQTPTLKTRWDIPMDEYTDILNRIAPYAFASQTDQRIG